MHKKTLKISTALLIAIGLIACDANPPAKTYVSRFSTMMVLPVQSTVWDRMAADFHFKPNQGNPRVQRFIKQYARENYYYLIKFSEQARPYLFHIVQMLEERGLPAELALLPIIESEYYPFATSNKGAVGIWQLAYQTGRSYGLRHDQWYDGRRDIEAATKAALDHLQDLYLEQKKDWLLTLAAYNAGSGRVAAAIRKNKNLGKPTDYWSLQLPQETQYFVPKFLALVYLIKNHRALDIGLSDVPNKPYFDKVKLHKQIDLQQAAKLAGIDFKEVKRLNPAYSAHVTHPHGPHELVLPIQQVAVFKANFNSNPTIIRRKPSNVVAKSKNVLIVHTVNHGDTLHIIAAKYSTTIQHIKHKNNLTSDIIRRGQRLSI